MRQGWHGKEGLRSRLLGRGQNLACSTGNPYPAFFGGRPRRCDAARCGVRERAGRGKVRGDLFSKSQAPDRDAKDDKGYHPPPRKNALLPRLSSAREHPLPTRQCGEMAKQLSEIVRRSRGIHSNWAPADNRYFLIKRRDYEKLDSMCQELCVLSHPRIPAFPLSRVSTPHLAETSRASEIQLGRICPSGPHRDVEQRNSQANLYLLSSMPV